MLTMKDISENQLSKYVRSLQHTVSCNNHYFFTDKQQIEFNKMTPYQQEVFLVQYMNEALKELIENNEIYLKVLDEKDYNDAWEELYNG